MTRERRTKPLDRWEQSIMGTYGTPTLTFVRGSGAHLWDAEGNQYLDLVSGVAVNVLGHAHPAVVEAVTKQIAQLGHVSNLYASEPPIVLAERLLELFGERGATGRVFFCNSGAEANEAAFKLARRTGRSKMVSALGSFHGRTFGALALTGQAAKQAGFGALPGPMQYVPYGDTEALWEAVDDTTAAVFLEPVQGEGGIVPAPPGYLSAARAITEERGALLVLDEVQTGVGRTGLWFAHLVDSVEPDVVTVAKGLGGGLPIGACIAFGEPATLLGKGDHASTFGGNPVACAAALAVLDTIQSEGLLEKCRALGETIKSGITHSSVVEVRGRGLLIGVVLTGEVAGAVQSAAERAGYLVNAVAPDVIRIAPPLVIDPADVNRFLLAFPTILDEVLS